MIKKIKKEIKSYIKANEELNKNFQKIKKEEEILKLIPKKIKKGIREIRVEKESLKIITHSPSWRQETLFFKKEIMKKIDKKLANYDIKKTIIL
tara:strand:+ start:215 stop:496 length:282 start_codon:yes stop_codon:yes gene_type:complete